MTDRIRVRVYNVKFGDCILVTVPDRDPKTKKTTRRNLLVDFGNAPSGEGADKAAFTPAFEGLVGELEPQGTKGKKRLDLFVMTHEHLDHAQGPLWIEQKSASAKAFTAQVKVDSMWLTGSAAPDYYDTHPNAKKKKLQFNAVHASIAARLAALPDDEAKHLRPMLLNNSPQSTGDCVEFLRGLAPKSRTHYVHREFKTAKKHPFKEAKFEIWAPEEDTADYYAKLVPMALAAAGESEPRMGSTATSMSTSPVVPPPGVDAGAFFDLCIARENGFVDNLLAIDRVANDSSVVFVLEWRGLRLLFAGDAELRSWKMMAKHGVLKPVDFLKVSHHGSHNGTPHDDVLDRFLPKTPGSKRRSAISTWKNTYPGIPHSPTNAKLEARSKLTTMSGQPANTPFFDLHFEA